MVKYVLEEYQITPRDRKYALKKWYEEEVVGVLGQRYALGRFLFSATLGSAGLLVGLEKGFGGISMTENLAAMLVFLGIAAIVALYLAMPAKIEISGKSDLRHVHESVIAWSRGCTLVWVGSWLVGTFCGFVVLLQ